MLRRWTQHMLDVDLCFHWFEHFTFAKTAHCLVTPLKGFHLSYVFWSFDCKLSEGGSTWLHIHAQMYVCVYICAHPCVHFCTYVHIWGCMLVGVCVSMCVGALMCAYTSWWVCVFICACVYSRRCVRICTSVCVYSSVESLVPTFMHTKCFMCKQSKCVSVCMHLLLHLFLCVLVYVFICMCPHTHMRQTPAHMYSHIYISTNIYQHTKFSVMWLILGWPCAVDGALKSKKKMEGVGSLWARCRPTTP